MDESLNHKIKIFFQKAGKTIDGRKYLNNFPLSVIRYPLSVIRYPLSVFYLFPFIFNFIH